MLFIAHTTAAAAAAVLFELECDRSETNVNTRCAYSQGNRVFVVVTAR